MSSPFIGEIKIVGFNFAPRGYAFCNGALMNISQNAALYSLLGTQFGGNGTTNFAIPNLQGRFPINQGTSAGTSTTYTIGESGGAQSVTLNLGNLPAHTHGLTEANAKALIGCRTDTANGSSPGGSFLGTTSGNTYVSGQSASNSIMAPGTVAFAAGASTNSTGSNVPFSTIPPFLCVNFVIALQGIYPTRN